jgi:hypothetical protein
MRSGGLRLEDETELSRANALLPGKRIEVEAASWLQSAIYRGDATLNFALTLVLPAPPPGLKDDELSRTDLTAANDLRALLSRVRHDLQDKRSLAHAEQARELRHRAEEIKRATGGKGKPPVWKRDNDVPWNR